LHGQRCAHCGTSEQLEIHHRDRDAKVSHRICSWSPARQRVELAKCEFLCRGCHIAESRRTGALAAGAKLSPEDVLAIRSSGAADHDLAQHYGVRPETIRAARTGRTWAWIQHPAQIS
jgi:5-methylcytosine-specific restriction endonuclease McrA